MNAALIRERLHEQIEHLPDDVVQQIADFALFVMARRNLVPQDDEWEEQQWADFAMTQFFDEEDEVEYTLEDAQEVYQP